MVTTAGREDAEFVARAAKRFAQRLTVLTERYREGGRTPGEMLGDPEELADRALAAQAPVTSPWDDLIGPFLRSDGVQARLGISRQAVAAKAARRRLLRVFTSDGVALFPVWQFDDGSTLAGWLRTEDPGLGAVPLDALAEGDGELAGAVARTAAAALAG